jgi:hypothetical protein
MFISKNLEIQLTIDDPKAYTKRWGVKLLKLLKQLELNDELIEFICRMMRRTERI